ncbi:MAG: CapA family protein [Tenericutes bacterium]|jgi:poly-gamma-glutamate synthesis protein (capsule biosynthesis protein)|nr:CapA family protein [Mycoplasmatota bacterium]
MIKKRKIKKKVFTFCLLFILYLVSILSLGNYLLSREVPKIPKLKEEIKENYPKYYQASMIATGDALLHQAVYNDASNGDGTYNFLKQMELIKPLIKNYDLAFYNQESIIGGKSLGLSTYPRFNSPDEIGDCMVGLGFNMVSLANNHTLDKNEEGVLYSTAYWKTKDVLTAGSYNSWEDREEVRIKEKNNIKYTLLSYTTTTNGLLPPKGKEYLTNIYSDEKAKEDIEKLRNKVDLLIVSMHWGSEYTHVPTSEQTKIANYLASLGVDLIIGHHPHVLQPIQYIDNTLVFYSLGNYISAQEGIERLTGVLVSFNITKQINEDQSSSISFSDIKADLIYTKYSNWRNFKVYPYAELNDDILYSYQKHYDKYKSILMEYDNTIQVTSLE